MDTGKALSGRNVVEHVFYLNPVKLRLGGQGLGREKKKKKTQGCGGKAGRGGEKTRTRVGRAAGLKEGKNAQQVRWSAKEWHPFR